MSWASRRQATYIFGILAFVFVGVSVPVALLMYHPPTCFDGIQNQGETAIDRGGPCVRLDENSLSPVSVLWSRSFIVRPNNLGGGVYSSVAYIENLNKDAGAQEVAYHIGLYDDENVLIGERTGSTFVMPGTITPVFETGIDSGRRTVARTYFEFTAVPDWQRSSNAASVIKTSNVKMGDDLAMPRVSVDVENTSPLDVMHPGFVVVLFDSAGNAFSASATTLTRLTAGTTQTISFTWPSSLSSTVGRVEVLPRVAPKVAK